MRKDKMPIRNISTNTIEISRVMDDLQVSLNDWLAEIPAGTVEEKRTPSNQFCTRYTKRNSAL